MTSPQQNAVSLLVLIYVRAERTLDREMEMGWVGLECSAGHGTITANFRGLNSVESHADCGYRPTIYYNTGLWYLHIYR
jgi:hypothetical protein